MSNLKRCTRCVMPETWPGISFDENGVCSICREFEKKINIDWNERQNALKKILQKYKDYAKQKGNKYNCVIGFSGGKDSTYTLWAAVKKYGMTPLVVSFEHFTSLMPIAEWNPRLGEVGILSAQRHFTSLMPIAEWNLMEIPRRLNCDHIRFTIGDELRNALCRKGIEVNGDFCWFCHNGVGTLPARISKQWDIPLQIWGEPSAEYQTYGAYKLEDLEEQDKEHYEKVFQAGITPEKILPRGYELHDLMPMMWPEGAFLLKAIYLGVYEPWDQREHVKIITRELGWKHKRVEGTYVDWDKVDCPFEPVRDWQKFIKRGFGRTTFQASKDIREGLITREEGLRLVEKYDGKRPKALDTFLREVGITEEEFNYLTRKHIVRRE